MDDFNGAENNDEIADLMNEIGSQIQFTVLQDSMLKHLPEDTSIISVKNLLIIEIKPNTFHQFLRVQKIDLSNNLLSDLDSNLFSIHEKLEEIDFSKNALQFIDPHFLFHSPVLRELNFSSNSIKRIEENCIFSFSLTQLNLSDNKIETVHPEAFFYLPELKFLNLSNNLIELMSVTAVRLVKLEANNNPLKSMYLHSNRIESIFLHNNRIVWFDNFCLTNIETLTELEFTDNDSYGHGFLIIYSKCLKHFYNLQTLKLKVKAYFDSISLRPLINLKTFQLNYEGSINLAKTSQSSFAAFFSFVNSITTLTLIVDFFFANYLDQLFILQNLKKIYVRCLRPTDVYEHVRIHKLFERSPSIESIKLINLNEFLLPKHYGSCDTDFTNLKKLTLVGLKNDGVDNYFNRFRSLRTLKLIDGNISWIKTTAFQNLKLLTKLYLEKLKLKHINPLFTQRLLNLEFLSLMNNEIVFILPHSFSHLKKLKILNLKGNPLNTSLIDASTFFNLNTFGTKILVDDESFLIF